MYRKSVCWQAHRGYPFCSRRSEAEDHSRRSAANVLRPTIHNRGPSQSGTTLRPETCPKYIKTTRNQETQFRKKMEFQPPAHCIRGIINTKFVILHVPYLKNNKSYDVQTLQHKIASHHDPTTPQPRNGKGSSPFQHI